MGVATIAAMVSAPSPSISCRRLVTPRPQHAFGRPSPQGHREQFGASTCRTPGMSGSKMALLRSVRDPRLIAP
jgi:hypothetical protein